MKGLRLKYWIYGEQYVVSHNLVELILVPSVELKIWNKLQEILYLVGTVFTNLLKVKDLSFPRYLLVYFSSSFVLPQLLRMVKCQFFWE